MIHHHHHHQQGLIEPAAGNHPAHHRLLQQPGWWTTVKLNKWHTIKWTNEKTPCNTWKKSVLTATDSRYRLSAALCLPAANCRSAFILSMVASWGWAAMPLASARQSNSSVWRSCRDALLANPVGQTAACAEKTSVTGSSLAALCSEARRESTKASRLGWVTLKRIIFHDFQVDCHEIPAPAKEV